MQFNGFTFYSLGLLVGAWPLSTIMVTLLIGGVLCTGLAYFNEDTSYETWIPTTAPALDHQEWVQERFPADYRVELATVSIKNPSGSFAQAEYLAQVGCLLVLCYSYLFSFNISYIASIISHMHACIFMLQV